jgi:hypothetical protein
MIKLNRDFLAGAVVGFAAGFVAKGASEDNPDMKNLGKAAIKAGLVGFENIRVHFSQMVETVSDMVAEVRAEKKTEEAQANGEGEREVEEAEPAPVAKKKDDKRSRMNH